MWQDYALTAIQIAFCITLIPMLRATEKPPLTSSVSNGVVILMMAAIMSTLHLWIAVAAQAIVGIQWLVLAYQKWQTSRAIN